MPDKINSLPLLFMLLNVPGGLCLTTLVDRLVATVLKSIFLWGVGFKGCC